MHLALWTILIGLKRIFVVLSKLLSMMYFRFHVFNKILVFLSKKKKKNIYSYVSFNKFLSNFEPKSAFPNISQDPFNNLPRTFPRILHITTSHIGSFLNAGPSAYHRIYEAANQIGIRASSVTTITAQGTQKTFLYIYSTMSMVRLNDKRKDIT